MEIFIQILLHMFLIFAGFFIGRYSVMKQIRRLAKQELEASADKIEREILRNILMTHYFVRKRKMEDDQ